MTIYLGLCCLNTELRNNKPPIYCSRTCIRKNFSINKAKELATNNIEDMNSMIKWNIKNNIHCFRLSSNLYPHFTDSETEKYDINFSKNLLELNGKLANESNMRIVMHPGQYNQIATPHENVFNKTIEDLTHHANILDYMNIPEINGNIIVHGGGIYNDKENTIRKWLDRFDELPNCVRKRLVLENCERNYSIEDCLYIHSELNIPIVFDFHHHQCYQIIHQQNLDNLEEILEMVSETWQDRILMHISEQGHGKIGHHSDFIENIPNELIKFADDNPNKIIDLEIEAKMKEQAIFKLRNKYSFLR